MHRWSSKEAGTLRVLFLNVAEEKRRGLITKLDFSCCFIKLLPHLKPTRLIFFVSCQTDAFNWTHLHKHTGHKKAAAEII